MRPSLSFTEESGRPTMVNFGKPEAVSASTRTRCASTPRTAAVSDVASMVPLQDPAGETRRQGRGACRRVEPAAKHWNGMGLRPEGFGGPRGVAPSSIGAMAAAAAAATRERDVGHELLRGSRAVEAMLLAGRGSPWSAGKSAVMPPVVPFNEFSEHKGEDGFFQRMNDASLSGTRADHLGSQVAREGDEEGLRRPEIVPRRRRHGLAIIDSP